MGRGSSGCNSRVYRTELKKCSEGKEDRFILRDNEENNEPFRLAIVGKETELTTAPVFEVLLPKAK